MIIIIIIIHKIFANIYFPLIHHIPLISKGNQVQVVLPVSLGDCDTAIDYKLQSPS